MKTIVEEQEKEKSKESKEDIKKKPKEEPNTWHCEEYENLMEDKADLDISRTFFSAEKKEELKITSQRELMLEFMKILSLAHMCEPEHFVDREGNDKRFYNGPSPDEVALVDFANSMHFECLESSDEVIKLKMKDFPSSYGEVKGSNPLAFEVFRKMDFTSDRKRMSVLLRDPIDGKIKLLTKGADSIIKARLDAG